MLKHVHRAKCADTLSIVSTASSFSHEPMSSRCSSITSLNISNPVVSFWNSIKSFIYILKKHIIDCNFWKLIFKLNFTITKWKFNNSETTDDAYLRCCGIINTIIMHYNIIGYNQSVHKVFACRPRVQNTRAGLYDDLQWSNIHSSQQIPNAPQGPEFIFHDHGNKPQENR